MKTALARLVSLLTLALALFVGGSRAEEPVLKPGDRILFIGDSITMQGETQWCRLIEKALKETGRWKDNEIRVVASSGQTVGSWLRLEAQSKEKAITFGWTKDGKYDVGKRLDEGAQVLVIMLGMNDVLSPYVRDTEKSYRAWKESYRTLIGKLRDRCKPGALGLALPTPCTEDPASPKNRVMDRMVKEISALAEEEGCFVLPTRDAAWEVLRTKRRYDPKARITSDQVHPTGDGHTAIAVGMLRGLGEPEAAAFLLQSRLQQPEHYLSYQWTAQPQPAADEKHTYRLRVFHSEKPVQLALPAGWSEAKATVETGNAESAFTLTGIPERLVNPVTIKAGELTQTAEIPAPWLVATATTLRKGWAGNRFDSEAARFPADEAIRTGKEFSKTMNVLEAPKGKPLAWTTFTGGIAYEGRGSPGVIDFMGVTYFSSGDTGYGMRWVRCEKETPALLKVDGTSGSMHLEAWLNGETVYAGDFKKADKKGYPVTLQPGWNLLSFKSSYLFGPWSVILDLRTPEDKPMPDLPCSALPPGE